VAEQLASAIRDCCNVKHFSIWTSEKSGDVKFTPLCGYNLKKLAKNFTSFVPLIESPDQRQLKRDAGTGTHWDLWEKWKVILEIFSKKSFGPKELEDNGTVDKTLKDSLRISFAVLERLKLPPMFI
jgi:hypothetical protein